MTRKVQDDPISSHQSQTVVQSITNDFTTSQSGWIHNKHVVSAIQKLLPHDTENNIEKIVQCILDGGKLITESVQRATERCPLCDLIKTTSIRVKLSNSNDFFNCGRNCAKKYQKVYHYFDIMYKNRNLMDQFVEETVSKGLEYLDECITGKE